MATKGHDVRLIEAIEAIYEELETVAPPAWLDRVNEIVSRFVEAPSGVVGHAYDLRGPRRRWHISRPRVFDGPEAFAGIIEALFERMPPENLLDWYGGAGPAGTFSALTGMTLDQLPGTAAASKALDAYDQIYVNAGNPDVDGVMFVANLGERRTLGRRVLGRLSMIAAHAAAATRLLRARGGRRVLPAAVFEADGRVAHVERTHSDSVPALRQRIARIDRARGSMRRRDPDGAAALWAALLAGRYSTFDRFDHDGRRYVVAYDNEPGVLDPRGLTPAEASVARWASRGHADKVIAYELGVAQGTVSTLLSRVYKKLGVRGRAELVARMREPSDVSRVALNGLTGVVAFSSPIGDERFATLTKAEREVAMAAASGASLRAIAKRRRTSEATARTQLASAYTKLGVSTRAELAALPFISG